MTIDMLYDSLNRLTGKTYTIPAGSGAAATSTVNYYYDEGGANAFANGRRTRLVDGSGSTTWSYDGRGRVTSSTQSVSGAPSYTTSWTYNSADLPVTMTYPSGEVVTFTYNTQMLLQGLSSSEGGQLIPRTRTTMQRAG